MVGKKDKNLYDIHLDVDKVYALLKILSQINKTVSAIGAVATSNYVQLGNAIDQAEALIGLIQTLPKARPTADFFESKNDQIRSLKDFLFSDVLEIFQETSNIFSAVGRYRQTNNMFVVANLRQFDQYWNILLKNMFVYLRMLHVFKAYLCNLYVTYTQRYTEETNYVHKNIEAITSSSWVDKDLTLNFWFICNDKKDNFASLATLYSTTFTFLNKCFTGSKFTSMLASLHDYTKSISDMIALKTTQPIRKAVPYDLFDTSTVDQEIQADSGEMYFEKSIFANTNIQSSMAKEQVAINSLFNMLPKVDKNCPAAKGNDRGGLNTYDDDDDADESDDDDKDTKPKSLEDLIGKPIEVFNMDYKLPTTLHEGPSSLPYVMTKKAASKLDEAAVDSIVNTLFVQVQEYLEELRQLVSTPNSSSKYAMNLMSSKFSEKLEQIYYDLNEVLDTALDNTNELYKDLGLMPLDPHDIEDLLGPENAKNFVDISQTGDLMDTVCYITLKLIPLLPAIFSKIKDHFYSIDNIMHRLERVELNLNAHNLLRSSTLQFHLNNFRTCTFMIQNFLPIAVCKDYHYLIQNAMSWFGQLKSKFPSAHVQLNGLVLTSLEEILLTQDTGFFDNKRLLDKFTQLNTKSISELFNFAEYALYYIIEHNSDTSKQASKTFLKRKRPYVKPPSSGINPSTDAVSETILMHDREIEYISGGAEDTAYYINCITTANSRNVKPTNSILYQWLMGVFEPTLWLGLLEGGLDSQKKVVDIFQTLVSIENYEYINQKREAAPESVPQLLELNIIRLLFTSMIFLGEMTYDAVRKVAIIDTIPFYLRNVINDLVKKSTFMTRLSSNYNTDFEGGKFKVKLDVDLSDRDKPFKVDTKFFTLLNEYGSEPDMEFPNLIEHIVTETNPDHYSIQLASLDNRVDLSGKFALLQKMKKIMFTTVSIHSVKMVPPSYCLSLLLHEAETLEINVV